MKIVNIIGGLGNQMFQYALLIALRERFKEDIFVDTTSFATYGLHNGLELEKVFGIRLHLASIKDIEKLAYYSPNYKWNRIMKRCFPRKKTTCYEFPLTKFIKEKLYLAGDMYYEGYWQHYSYFDEYRDIIKQEYHFQGSFNEEALMIRNAIINDNSVAIHIRRGDYLKEKDYIGICDLEYYRAAIDILNKRYATLHYYIFSNDLEWCKENIAPLLKQYSFVDCHKGEESYKDMWLMSLCKNMILANSSFSWWAAYLNENEGVIIAPKKWTNNSKTYSRQLPNWILV